MELDASQINYDNEETDKKEVGYGKVEQTNVRRKLFQEDGTENNEEYQDFGTVTICEQGNQMAQKNWNRETKDENRTESKSYGKEEGVVVLLISFCKDVQLMNLIEERAKVLATEIEVCHCFPESSFRICSLRTYSLIFLDLNGDVIENFFRVSLAIRSSTFSNHSTPIIGFKHADTIKDDRWKNYGITEIIYGPLYHSAIDGVLGKFISQTVKREPQDADDKVNRNLAFIASTSGRQDEKRPPSYQKATSQSLDVNFSKHPWTSNRSNASPMPACDSTDQVAPYCESENSESAIHQIEGQSGYVDDKITIPQSCTTYLTTGQSSLPTYSSHCQMQLASSNANRQIQSESVMPNSNSGAVTQLDVNAAKQNPSGWNVIQQILDLHQNVQKDVDSKPKVGTLSGSNTTPITKAPTSQPSATPSATVYPSTCQYPQRSYQGNSVFTTPVVPQNTSYMVNGTPGCSNMRISIVPDDYAKHSSKERERRERIKESCDELRKLLPKQLMAGRRQDMATVLELTVYYLKVVQEHLPTIIQQQLYQKFLNYQDPKSRRKRKGAEMTPYMAQSKYQRHAAGAAAATATATTATSGYHLVNYTNATYTPQAMQSNSHQPTNTGYFSSIYHPLITNPYYATMNPNASQNIYGSASHMPMPIMDHAMHLRSQYYNETIPTQSGLPCYLAVTSSSRDLANSNITR